MHASIQCGDTISSRNFGPAPSSVHAEELVQRSLAPQIFANKFQPSEAEATLPWLHTIDIDIIDATPQECFDTSPRAHHLQIDMRYNRAK